MFISHRTLALMGFFWAFVFTGAVLVTVLEAKTCLKSVPFLSLFPFFLLPFPIIPFLFLSFPFLPKTPHLSSFLPIVDITTAGFLWSLSFFALSLETSLGFIILSKWKFSPRRLLSRIASPWKITQGFFLFTFNYPTTKPWISFILFCQLEKAKKRSDEIALSILPRHVWMDLRLEKHQMFQGGFHKRFFFWKIKQAQENKRANLSRIQLDVPAWERFYSLRWSRGIHITFFQSFCRRVGLAAEFNFLGLWQNYGNGKYWEN